MAAVRGRRRGDHPRSRGVYSRSPWDRTTAQGSSPLARGLRETPFKLLVRERIIPARAGFTLASQSRRRSSRDHPRSRGVYALHQNGHLRSGGSSPLARGLHHGAVGPARARGIIPARAGFTRSAIFRSRTGRDHPRSRGVYLNRIRLRSMRRGSSPLARGLPLCGLNRSAQVGIIPARAGFTKRQAPNKDVDRDHPRSRGVYQSSMLKRLTGNGSSPLARGLRGLSL